MIRFVLCNLIFVVTSLVRLRAQETALIPLPVTVNWKQEKGTLQKGVSIRYRDNKLSYAVHELQDFLNSKGIIARINTSNAPAVLIELIISPRLEKISSNEGYYLKAAAKKIELKALSDTGIYRGLQTLKQLLETPQQFQTAEITDQPAYPWRGYMVDVGRNYQTMELLKRQIDRMAVYKLNTFHFHVTEDIAWRLEVPGFPALTADSTMLRDPGMYYSISEMKELIRYCEERYIRFVLEIDMPGHSAAFERAMGVSMQSEKGTQYVQEILRTVATTLPIKYIHIGGDEVTITNPGFLPVMTRLLDSLGIESLGWSPGGNLANTTIHQLWMSEAPIIPGIRYIDSRHLYLNHMDPHEAVVTLFHRQIGDRTKADASMLGGIICVWNDRRLINENYHLLINGVYPSMLAFAERSWRGGGILKWTAVIGEKNTNEANQFIEFEGRLMKHKKAYFRNEPFPYFAQSKLEWSLFGPFSNNGNLKQVFDPELAGFFSKEPQPALNAIGASIVLRHWWAPAITGHIPDPKENTTWYARTRIFSEVEGWRNCWIGFNNFSRSMITRTPDLGQWDERSSVLWFNGDLVPAPEWKRSGKTISLETPLEDEDYYYRTPTRLYFKKGWNEVLIKAPVGSFKGSDWQNPVKWMFSFLPVD